MLNLDQNFGDIKLLQGATMVMVRQRQPVAVGDGGRVAVRLGEPALPTAATATNARGDSSRKGEYGDCKERVH